MDQKGATPRPNIQRWQQQRIYQKANGYCTECDCKVFFHYLIKKHRKLAGRAAKDIHYSGSHIRWITPYGSTMRAKKATIGHIIPRWRGGSNKLSNFKLECSQCNGALNRKDTKSFVKTKTPCKICGVTIKNTYCKRCQPKYAESVINLGLELKLITESEHKELQILFDENATIIAKRKPWRDWHNLHEKIKALQ